MKKFLTASCLILPFLLSAVPMSSAQTIVPIDKQQQSAQPSTQPQFFVTWKAKSYAPPGFLGKVLPTANSPITASFEILNPLTGKFIDLSTAIIDPDTGKLTTRAAYKAKLDQRNKDLLDSVGAVDQFVPAPLPPPPTIGWYANDQLIKTRSGGEQGSQTVSFRVPSLGGGISLKIQLSDFDLNAPFFTVLDIPVVQPEIIVETPFGSKQFSTPSVHIKAVPYFFNVASPAELNYSWNVNGKEPQNAENPAELTINVNPEAPSGSTISVSVAALNPKNKSEAGNAFLDLTYFK